MNQDDAVRIVALAAMFGLLGYYLGRIAQARDAEASEVRRRVWDLEAQQRQREYDEAVKAGKVPAGPKPPGVLA